MVDILKSKYWHQHGNRPAFVLNTRAQGLGVARSLSIQGVPVIAADYQEDVKNRKSRSILAHINIPDIEKEPDSAVEALIKVQSDYGEKGVLFPSSDAYVLWVSRQRSKLARHFDMALPAEEVVEGIMDKRKQYEYATRYGIPIPETHFPQNLADLNDFKDDILYPVLLKPCYSHKWQKVFNNKGFQVFNSAELQSRFQQVIANDLETDVMIQRVITGPSTNLFGVRAYLDKNGEAHGAINGQKIRQYPVDFGIGTLVRTVHNEMVTELGLRFMKCIGYRGIGSVEFKKDPIDNTYRLMELNARSVKNNIIAVKAGVNLPWLMYQDLTGMQIDADKGYSDNIIWHDFINDCRSYMDLKTRGEMTFGDWARGSLTSDCHPYFDWQDLGPSLEVTLYGARCVRELFYVMTFSAGQLLKRGGRPDNKLPRARDLS